MAIPRTYFFNQMGEEDLVMLFRRRENFFLENVEALDLAIARIRATLGNEGMSSVVELVPTNPPPRFNDLFSSTVPVLGLAWAFFRGLASFARPRHDVTLRLTSNTSVSVVF